MPARRSSPIPRDSLEAFDSANPQDAAYTPNTPDETGRTRSAPSDSERTESVASERHGLGEAQQSQEEQAAFILLGISERVRLDAIRSQRRDARNRDGDVNGGGRHEVSGTVPEQSPSTETRDSSSVQHGGVEGEGGDALLELAEGAIVFTESNPRLSAPADPYYAAGDELARRIRQQIWAGQRSGSPVPRGNTPGGQAGLSPRRQQLFEMCADGPEDSSSEDEER